MLKRITTIFFSDCSNLADQIRWQTDTGVSGAKAAAHSLKGAAGNIGLLRIAELARTAEGLLDTGDAAAVARLQMQLVEDIAATKLLVDELTSKH